MAITTAVKMALQHAGKKNIDLAARYNWTKQALSTKMGRDSWDGRDLEIVAEFTGGKLVFQYDDGTTIPIHSDPEKLEQKGKKVKGDDEKDSDSDV